MSIYNEYLTGEARELAVENARIQNEFDKLYTMFEMTNLQLAQMQRDAELKVFAESGTYDDLTYLLQEADAEVAGQRKNILQRIVEAIGKVINSIAEGIKSIFSSGSPDQEVEVPVEVVEKTNVITRCINDAQNGFNKLRQGDFTGAKDILKAIVIPGAVAAAGAAAGTYAVKKMPKSQVEQMTNTLKGCLDKVKSVFDSGIAKLTGITDTNKQKDGQEAVTPVQKILNVINSIIDALKSAVLNSVNKAKEVAGNVKDAVTGNKGEKQEPVPIMLTGLKFVVNPDASVQLFDKNGKEQKVNMKKLPSKVRDVVKKIQAGEIVKPAANNNANNNNANTNNNAQGQQTNESVEINYLTVDDIREIVGNSYEINITTEGAIELTELEEISMESTSIFGYDITNELLFEEATITDAFDMELEELSELFNSL